MTLPKSTADNSGSIRSRSPLACFDRIQASIEDDLQRVYAELSGPTAALMALDILRHRLLNNHPETTPLSDTSQSSKTLLINDILHGVPGILLPADLDDDALEELAHWFADNVDFTTIDSEQGEK